MRNVLLLISLLAFTFYSRAQGNKNGKIIEQKILSVSIQGNHGDEDPQRNLTIYLPPGYESAGNQRYPVIYLLHGFGANDKSWVTEAHIDAMLDTAIRIGLIRPVIVVMPNSHSRFRGSFYSNSSLAGNWGDFISKDLVRYIDKTFRTIPDRNSRGLAGHSMGGHGAVKIGMLSADVFGSVYAMSPAVLNWGEEMNVNNPAFKTIDHAKTEAEIMNSRFFTLVLTSLARAFSPNEQKPPIFANLPVSYRGDSMVVNVDVAKQWEANFPINMINDRLAALKSLNAFKIDWGRNDEFPHIPATCLQFSKKLEAYGVKHTAEEYNGTHGDRLEGIEGRIFTELIPFFSATLRFEIQPMEGAGNEGKKERKLKK